MKLNFEYSIETELARVRNTLQKKDFYIKNGYKIIMPLGYSLRNNDFDNVEKQIEKEFDKEKFNKLGDNIIRDWNKHEAEINAFLNSLPYKIPTELIITFTQYGVGGSYKIPNKIIININYNVNSFRNIIHELIHLIIEKPVIMKFNIEHWDKESLVDYLLVTNIHLNKLFPDYKYQKNKPHKGLLDMIEWN